jgi:hypothetical protein
MSHPTDWTCRSCRAVLGTVSGGVLRPLVPVASVDGRGVARVPCPACGRLRVWEPSGDRRPSRAWQRCARQVPDTAAGGPGVG